MKYLIILLNNTLFNLYNILKNKLPAPILQFIGSYLEGPPVDQ